MLYINKHINYTMNWMNSYKNQNHKADQPKDSQFCLWLKTCPPKRPSCNTRESYRYYICNNCL